MLSEVAAAWRALQSGIVLQALVVVLSIIAAAWQVLQSQNQLQALVIQLSLIAAAWQVLNLMQRIAQQWEVQIILFSKIVLIWQVLLSEIK